MNRRERVPYADLDRAVVPLVRVLNRFPGISTYTSCGGHEGPLMSSQCPAGLWYVDFHVDRSDEGWLSLEFFGWVAYDLAPDDVELQVLAKPPHLNSPGEMLFFRWTGVTPTATTPAVFAETLREARRRFYVTARQAARWSDD